MSEGALVLKLLETYHRIEKGKTMRTQTPSLNRYTNEAEGTFRDSSRRDALRWLASQLRWERTLDHLRCDDRDQAAQAA